jgi:hypothetical protein
MESEDGTDSFKEETNMIENSVLAAREGAVVAPASPSALSWAAIVAGATAAAALSLVLLILGTGLGLSSVSPWASQGASAPAFGIGTIAWITFTQLAAAGMGGYLAGRLRTRWAATHIDEVFFRDTAHGFLAWALATLATAALLTSTIGSILGSGAQAGAAVVGGAAGTAAAGMSSTAGAAKPDNGGASVSGYFVDMLFRREAGNTANAAAAADDASKSVTEVSRIFASALSSGTLSPEDTKYVGQLVAQRNGMPAPDAERRVTDVFARMQAKTKELETTARDAADKARKASAYGALWLFVSLLVGAFCASLAATFGGRSRDQI